MLKVPSIILFLLISAHLSGQSPHGDALKMKCNVCHTTKDWSVKEKGFDHNTTSFKLLGQHKDVSCKACHPTLVFTDAKSDCASCHKDVHQGTVGRDCDRCHNTNSWMVGNITEIHRQSRFPLEGGHTGVDCNRCHQSGSRLRFDPMSTECVSCHLKDYNATTNPAHAAALFSKDCKSCHDEIDWKHATFNHNTATSFPLSGGHLNLTCNQCHTQGFIGTSTACVACHLKDYNATTNPAHAAAQFPTDCKMCHNEVDWKSSTFDHNTSTTFPLRGGHIGLSCNLCHSKGYVGTSTTCVSCHQKDYDASTNPSHVAAGFSTDCQTCHTEVSWKSSSFNHNTATSFPLSGGHLNLTCNQCHTQGFIGTSTACVACHLKDYNATTNPAHAAAQFPTDCKMCHNEVDWKSSTFDHNTSTTFPLRGGHIGLSCNLCHSKGYVGTSTTCVSCHQKDYDASTNPSHVAAGFSTDCQTCHTEVSWKSSSFNHNTATSFPLSGGHLNLTCNQCHTQGYIGTSTACVACHLKDYNATTNPAHAAAQFPTDCKMCHNEVDWKSATFDHNTSTTFPLKGGHLGLSCNQCHTQGYAGTSTACVACHLKDYNATTDPIHSAAGFSTDCQTCHTDASWKTSSFNHTTATSFPLSGGHLNLTCNQCHTQGFKGTSTACVACHLKDYNATTNPAHAAAQFPTDCKMCHNEVDWKSSTFDHNTSTTFPLKGGHLGLSCNQCHTQGYAGTSTACVACHLKDYNATTDPIHSAAGFSTDCQTCHTDASWKTSSFNHTTATSFPLNGGHQNLTCNLCHSQGFAGTSTACVACHLKDYNATTNPAHAAAQFPTDCKMCHDESAWTNATFDHNKSTTFPLKGGHLGLTCIKCHTLGYIGTSSACVACHLKDFNATTNPVHSTAGFSSECQTCHTDAAWKPSSFNHNTATSFALTGAHRTLTCNQCHTVGFKGTSTACVACHLSDYNATTNPAHAAAKFPSTCETCHNTTVWTTTTFNHDSQYFPIYSGNHRGQWTTCSQCHTNAANFAVFSCLTCHEHSKTSMDAAHKGRSGYVYNSTNCLSCHPRGSS